MNKKVSEVINAMARATPSRLVGQAVTEYARTLSKLTTGKTERGLRELTAAGLEDMKREIGEVQEALAPGVTF